MLQNEVSLRHIVDTVVTIIVVHSLCTSSWRGLWELVDLGLFPENHYHSAYASLAIGYAATLLAYGLQFIAQLKSVTGVGHMSRVSFDQSLTVLTHFATALTWRGWWKTYALFIFPDDPGLAGTIGHVTGFVGLALLGASSTLSPRGAPLDGGDEPSESLLISLDYTQYYLKNGCYCCHSNSDNHHTETEMNGLDIGSDVKLRT